MFLKIWNEFTLSPRRVAIFAHSYGQWGERRFKCMDFSFPPTASEIYEVIWPLFQRSVAACLPMDAPTQTERGGLPPLPASLPPSQLAKTARDDAYMALARGRPLNQGFVICAGHGARGQLTQMVDFP